MITERASRTADGILTAAVVGLTLLLGCQEVFDADLWWHLRAGRWVLENRDVPGVDTFTYGSAGRPWVDLHWAFQVALALAYRAGGVPGTVVLAAAGVASVALVGLGSRRGVWPAWVVAAAWLPGLLLASCRFDPRPELVTLFCLASYFGILTHARRRPGWLWLLVPVQVVWVNSHGLFVLGPWALGLFLADRAVPPGGGPPWRRVVPPAVAAVAACLLNPYGVRGLLFPLQLYPKLTEGGGLYKSYIAEFASPRTQVASFWAPWGHALYLRLFVFLLVALPLVVLVPALWRAWARGRQGDRGVARVGVWVGGMVLALGLALAVAAGAPVRETPGWRVGLGRAVPWLLAVAGFAAAGALGARSRLAAATAVAGFGATSAWVVWLDGHLFAPEPDRWPGAVALGLGLPAGLLALRAGTRCFGPLLAASFAYLGLLAVRNMSLFGLVSGAVLAAELGEWAAEMGHGAGPARAGKAARLAVLCATGLLAASVASGRFFSMAEDCHRFGLRERPAYYAHDACRFAGRPGLPDRALVFGLTQAGVYDFHNAPARRAFIDGRLEVASRAVFEAYVRVHALLTLGDPRGPVVLGRMGSPLILLDHQDNADAEATLLADPGWRCVYLDAVAAVFLPRDPAAVDPGLERAYPTVDFAGRHFRHTPAPATAVGQGSALAEAQAMVRVHSILARRSAPAWSLRIPIDLGAMDRAREALAETPGAAGPWMVLGHSALALVGEPRPGPAGPAAPWDPALGLPWAQATFAYREALRREPSNELIGRALAGTFAIRGMDDARRAAEGRSDGTDAVGSLAAIPTRPGGETLAPLLDDLLRRGRPAAAVALAGEARRRGRVLTWAVADRVACAQLHLGEPASARRTWLEAADPPSRAVLASRVGDAAVAAWDLEAAEAGYRLALSHDPDLAEAQVGLALVGLEKGDAGGALLAAREALKATPAPGRGWLLEGVVSLCGPYAR